MQPVIDGEPHAARGSDPRPDPTPVRDQAALTTSSGRIWLVVGGLLAIIEAGVLAALAMRPPNGVAIGGAIAVVVLYAVMVVTRLVVAPGRRRLGAMAGAMIAIAVVSLGCVLVIAGQATP